MDHRGEKAYQLFVKYHIERLSKSVEKDLLERFHVSGENRKKERPKILASQEYQDRFQAILEGDPYVGCAVRGEEPSGKVLMDYEKVAGDLKAIVEAEPAITPDRMMERLQEVQEEHWWEAVGPAAQQIREALEEEERAESLLEKAAREVGDEFAGWLENNLATKPQYLLDGSPLTEENLEEFLTETLDYVPSEDGWEIIPSMIEDGGYIAGCLGWGELEKLMMERFFSYFGAGFGREEPWKEDVSQRACRELHDLLWDWDVFECTYEQVRSYFDEETVRRLLRQNPHHQDLARAEEEKERAEKEAIAAILTAMPDSHPKLYPLARAMKRHFVLHVGPTNSGKTYAAIEALKEAGEGIYLGPLRLLAYEQYEKLNGEGFPCDMITGEEERLMAGARICASTVEMLPLEKRFPLAVIDEAQMCGDRSRGGAWTTAILGVRADTVHVCLAPEGEGIITRLIEECGDSYEIICHERKAPLVEDTKAFRFPKDVREGDALVVFSRRAVIGVAAQLQELGISCSIIYGSLPYDVRHEQAEAFASGVTKVVVATDAIGMGMNLPIRRVVMMEMSKFDGVQERTLTGAECRQIIGRAGRFGIQEGGTYTSLWERKILHQVLKEETPPIKEAYLRFPASILYLGKSLSETIERWGSIPAGEGYEKESIGSQLVLARLAEEKMDDRRLVYAFSRFPVDYRDAKLMDIWRGMVDAEATGKAYQPPSWISSDLSTEKLSYLEEQYKACDLLHVYAARFHPGSFAWTSRKREEISAKIIAILKSQKFSLRRCSRCGCPLDWSHPYGMCETCHEILYPQSYRNHWDW